MLDGIICLVASIGCLIYSLCAFQQRGPLLTTLYYIASSKERSKMKTKKEYHFVAKVFLLISIAFGAMFIGEILKIQWALNVAILVLIITAVYVLIISVKDSIKK